MKISISSPSFSILVNGSPKDLFKSNRGLRQGDPLSSYLFIMVVELLNCMVSKAEFVGILEGFYSPIEGPSTPFFQSVDHYLLLLKANPKIMKNLHCILLILEVATGLKVNLSKTTLSSVGDVHNIDELSTILGCSVVPLLITYLVLPLGAKASLKTIWNPVRERMWRKLSNWKGRYLSKGGKLVLLRSVLSTLPFFFFFFAPVSMVNQIERIQRDFLWNDDQGMKKNK